MKIIIITIFCLLSILGRTNAFFGDSESLDLYKNIDKGIIDLENKMIEFELEGGSNGGGILKEINEYAILEEYPACLDESKTISIKEFEKIIEFPGNIDELTKYQVSNCLEKQIYDTKRGVEIEKINNKYKEQRKIIEEDYSKKIDDTSDIVKSIKLKSEKNRKLSALSKDRKKEINNLKTIIENSDTKTFSIDILNSYLLYFKQYKKETELLAKIKTDKIYKLSNIGLYSDGNLENSGFDLIVDIEEIDKIIFANENEYIGEPIEFDKNINDFMSKGTKDINDQIESLNNNINKLNDKTDDKIEIFDDYIDDYIYTPSLDLEPEAIKNGTNNTYLCTGSLNNTGFSANTLDFLLNDIDKYNGTNDKVENNILEKVNLENNGNNSTNTSTNDKDNNENKSKYQEIVDNEFWPCENFFCITVDYITYQQNLFGGSEDITIEYLLNRSNEHLKKYAGTSLIPAKMTTGNFQIGLENLNMSDIFHLSFQVSTKPVPILKIQNKESKDDSEYSSNNMLKQYYKINGLDYKRRNDLAALKKIEKQKQTINNGAGLSIDKVTNNFKEYETYQNDKKIQIEFINKSIESKVSHGIMQNFEEQFSEISKFTVGIKNYIKNIDSIIGEMKKIPIDKG